MVIIDVHGHFGLAVGGATAPPARLTTYAGVCGVDLVLASNADAAVRPGGADTDEADANRACLEACRAHGRLVPLYMVRPGRADSHPLTLAGALETERFAGVVFAPAAVGFDLGDRGLDPYLSAVQRARRPALFCVCGEKTASPGRVYDLARRRSGLTCVLCNCGSSGASWAEALDVARFAAQREDARLCLDTSHATAREIASAVHSLGEGQVLFGTDAVRFGDAHLPRHIALLADLRRLLAPAALAAVLGGNAAGLFGLVETVPAPYAATTRTEP